MSVTIPTWVLWTAGVVGGLVIAVLAVLGLIFVLAFKGGIWK